MQKFNYVFGIPSYKRSEEQLTLSYLEEMGYSKEQIYISTQTLEDYEKYAKTYGNRANIVYCEGSCVSDNRNNLLNNFSKGTKIVMLDDDLKFIGHLVDKKIKPFTKEELGKFLEDAFKYAEKNHALIWTGYPVENGFFMSQTIDKKNFGVGCIMGIIVDKYRFDHDFKIKEDFEICLHTIKDGYNCIRFNFIHAKGKHKSKGGCEEFWKDNKDAECTKKILLRYPTLIKPGNKENSIIMKVDKNGK